MDDSQVEQDLVISRALIEIFSYETVQQTDAFRAARSYSSYIWPLLASGYEWDLVAMSEKVNDSLISRLND